MMKLRVKTNAPVENYPCQPDHYSAASGGDSMIKVHVKDGGGFMKLRVKTQAPGETYPGQRGDPVEAPTYSAI
jgi:hypothetical protein